MEFNLMLIVLGAASLVCATLAVLCGYYGSKAKSEGDEISAAYYGSMERIYTVLLGVFLICMVGFSQLDRMTMGVMKIVSMMEGLK